MATQTSTIRFSSEIERKAYSRGLAEVQRKLSGKRAETAAERHQRTLADGEASILRKLGRAGYIKAFGKEPSRTLDTPHTGTVKKYSMTIHRSARVPGGLFG